MADAYDYDYLIVGSGFGGSVSALRLSEKGYRVGVLECGRRYQDEDFASSTWDARRYYWMPKLGMKGILRLTLFKDVFIGSGCGVGGGSLGYANTLYRPRDQFYSDNHWSQLADWERELQPCFDEAERMLGVAQTDRMGAADQLLEEFAEHKGVADTFKPTRVGVYFGEPGKQVSDPYFGGEGPDRCGCIHCGGCMVGCRFGAKNTLVKNYLWFAEKNGVEILPERTVTDVRPLGHGDGSDGYAVASERSGAWVKREPQTLTARNVVVAAGTLGTNQLLAECKRKGSLARISDRLGDLVRTNSETILAVTARDDQRDFTDSIAITSSIYPDPDTHIEVVTYGRGGDSMSLLWALLTGDGTRLTRPLKFLGNAARHPVRFARSVSPRRWSRRTVILLVMQTLDNWMQLQPRRRLLGRRVRLQTRQDPDNPNPTFIPVANEAAEWIAQRIGGTPQSGIMEVLANIPGTAHILGGVPIGADPDVGVVDFEHRVFGYRNLMVCDGSVMPANPGVNPSLTITAMAERAMAKVPGRDAAAVAAEGDRL